MTNERGKYNCIGEWVIQKQKMNIEQTLKQMKLEDKVALGSGKDFWHTKEMPQYGIESIMVADGPHGLRKQPE